jgi:hypothetical protein
VVLIAVDGKLRAVDALSTLTGSVMLTSGKVLVVYYAHRLENLLKSARNFTELSFTTI